MPEARQGSLRSRIFAFTPRANMLGGTDLDHHTPPGPVLEAFNVRIGAPRPQSDPSDCLIEVSCRTFPVPNQGLYGPGASQNDNPRRDPEAPWIRRSRPRKLDSSIPQFLCTLPGAAKTDGSFEPISVPTPASLADQMGVPISDRPPPRHACAWGFVIPFPVDWIGSGSRRGVIGLAFLILGRRTWPTSPNI